MFGSHHRKDGLSKKTAACLEAMESCLEKMEATMKASQEEMKAMMEAWLVKV
jgi:hypothetical protein